MSLHACSISQLLEVTTFPAREHFKRVWRPDATSTGLFLFPEGIPGDATEHSSSGTPKQSRSTPGPGNSSRVLVYRGLRVSKSR